MASSSENLKKQKYLGKVGLVFYIILMNMFIPLSMDLYLPAMPTMTEHFNASSSMVNLTLVGFFFFFAVGTIVCGPMSDKYGRKAILLVGSGLYTVGSAICVVSPNVHVMIAARVLHGLGAGAIISVNMALVKDCFSGRQRETILAIVQSASGLAPMIAPVLGAFLLKLVDWRGAFVVLTAAGIVCLVLSTLYQETLADEDRLQESMVASLGKLITVGRNIGFLVPCIVFSLYNIAFMGYISVSSFIYVDTFGLSEQVYSYFFAANALVSLGGPLLYVRFLAKMDKNRLTYICFIGYLVSGALLVLIGQGLPIFFWFSFAIFTLLGSLIRPFSSNLLLEQQKADTGSASALINGAYNILGSIGMLAISMATNSILCLGAVILVIGVVSILGWTLLMRSSIPVVGVKK